MHQTESVADLVRDDIFKRLVQDFFRKLLAAHSLVDLGCLHEAPVVDEPDDVVVDKDGRVEDFSGDRIHPRRPHCVHRRVRDVPDA